MSVGSDYIRDTANWCLGINNFSAIKAVNDEKYKYNENSFNCCTKMKQTATELIHAGLKYATIGYTAFSSFKTWQISRDPILHALHLQSGVSLKSIELNAYVTPIALGTLGLYALYHSVRHCISKLEEIKKTPSSLPKNKEESKVKITKEICAKNLNLVQNIVFSAIPALHSLFTLDPSRAVVSVPILLSFCKKKSNEKLPEELCNAFSALPALLSIGCNGLAGSTASAPFFILATNCDNKATKVALSMLGLAVSHATYVLTA